MIKNKKTNIWVWNKDKEILESIKKSLDKNIYDVSCFISYEDLIDQTDHDEADLIILDWIFSGTSGLDVIKKMRSRSQFVEIPILILTTRTSENDKLKAFEIGVDDYIGIPFLRSELAARIKAILRRTKKEHLLNFLESSTIKLDRNSRRVTRNGREIVVGPTEYNLLEYLMLNKGKVLDRLKILENAWVKEEEIDLRTVDVHILRLRNALIIDNETDPIRTVRGVGYVFED